MRCAVRQQTDIDSVKWNEFVLANSMGWAHFLYEVIAIDRYASYLNLSFAIVDQDNNDDILFIMQLHRTSKYGFLTKTGLPFFREKLKSRWGYVIKDGLVKKHRRMVKECFEEYIDHYLASNPIKLFSAELAPVTQDRLNHRDGINPLVFFNFRPRIRYTWVVDLSKPDDRMLADCEETTQVIATVAVLIYRNTAYYWWGDSRNEKETGVNKYLLFKVICLIRESFGKTGYFETGGAYPYLRRGKYKGLNDFKKCFGTFLMPIYCGDYVKIKPAKKQ
ncbi:MAG: hypothetical protein IKS24_07850 [Bacteroidaceae bacterium]|nr:hypothetical protein [Bacteroidaceae bacterium]